jgi:hexosaminidase
MGARSALALLALACAAAASAQPATRAAAVSRAAATTPAAALAALVPKPTRVTARPGTFDVVAATAVVHRGGRDAAAVAEALAGHVERSTGARLRVRPARGAQPAATVLVALDGSLVRLGDEGYRLQVSPDGVVLRARRAAGLFYGVQTLRQLAALGSPTAWRLPAAVVEDVPRFAWRGLMLDVARHFFGVQDVERYVDLMALYKLNRLHLHLSDDQGWRIQIRSWPRLTQHGSRTEVGGGRGGHYTQRQYAELVRYAAARHVTLVPEIDMPGHVNAALASYATLNCDGRARRPYTGIEVGFSSLCIHKEVTYEFVDDVVRELAGLTPGAYLHVGGDEAHSTAPEDYRTFVRRVHAIVRRHGKRLIGWEDVARAGLAGGVVAQHWYDPDLARLAVSRGAKLIMSPSSKAYLDMKYAKGSPLGLTWAGTTSVRDAYEWDPATQVRGVRERDVLGVEAPLWTETATTAADLDYLAFPRLLGHAEIAWSRRGRSYADYRRRLGAHGSLLTSLGVRFFAAPGIPWR